MKKLAVICLLIASLHARGDLIVIENLQIGGRAEMQKSTTKIKGEKVRTDLSPGASLPGGTSTITDITSGDRITLNHQSKTFIKHPAKASREGDIALPEIADSGKKERVDGRDAEIYTAETHDVKFTFWVVKDYPDAAAVNEQMKKVWIMEALRNHMPDLTKLDGVVVKTEMLIKMAPVPGNVVDLTLVSAKIQAVDDSEFQVPAGYTEAAPPTPPPAPVAPPADNAPPAPAPKTP